MLAPLPKRPSSINDWTTKINHLRKKTTTLSEFPRAALTLRDFHQVSRICWFALTAEQSPEAGYFFKTLALFIAAVWQNEDRATSHQVCQIFWWPAHRLSSNQQSRLALAPNWLVLPRAHHRLPEQHQGHAKSRQSCAPLT